MTFDVTAPGADEARFQNRRHLWESGATIELPPVNGKPCTAIPIDLEALIEYLENCNSPDDLKALREKYATEILNFVWVTHLDTVTQNRIKGWMNESNPTKQPLPCVLIRVPGLGEKWFQVEIQPIRSDYLLVSDVQALVDALKPLEASKVLGIDTETTGLDPHSDQIRLLQIAAPGRSVVIVDLAAIPKADWEPLRRLLISSAVKVAHNWKFDLQILSQAGLKVSGKLFDTMLASQLLTAGLAGKRHSLAVIAKEYLDIELDKEQRLTDWTGELTPEQLKYAARDAAVLLKLRKVLKSRLIEAGLVPVAKLEFTALPAVAEMELSGMRLDLPQWQVLTSKLEAEKTTTEETLQKLLKSGNPQGSLFPEFDVVNLDSNQQVLKALQRQDIPIETTNSSALIPLADKYPVVKALLDYWKVAKAISSFGHALPEHINGITGRIHPDYWQCGSAAGRFSCSKPNLQQIPRDKEFRSCFVPEPGCKLVIADYSQVELRVAAEISQDERMIEAYQNGEDLHRLTASLISGKSMSEVTKHERQAAKAVNFGLIFAMGAEGLQRYAQNTYGVIMTLQQAETFRKRFFEAYKGLAKWHQKVKSQTTTEARTLSGRRRRWSEEPKLTELLNTPVQGSAADITKKALTLLPAALEGTGAKLIGTVHDEILLEVPEFTAADAARILKETMEAAGSEYLKLVPVEAEASVMNSWAEK